MAREIFIDTGPWIALFDRSDMHHAAATSVYRTVLSRWPVWVITNLVMAETYTLLRYRAGYRVSSEFLTRARSTSRLLTVYSTLEIEGTAEAILRQYSDQDLSFTDAVSFAVMRQRGITEAFAYDHHFLTAGFQRVSTAT